MISQICESFNCTPSQAQTEEVELCTNIMIMRQFAALYDRMRTDKKTLTGRDWEFLEWADAVQESS